MIVTFHPFAKDELFESALHYETKRPGLGGEFRTDVMRGAQLLLEHPKLGRKIDKSLYRLVLNRFPYSLIYFPSDTEVHIVAVAHHRKKPEFWQNRVDA